MFRLLGRIASLLSARRAGPAGPGRAAFAAAAIMVLAADAGQAQHVAEPDLQPLTNLQAVRIFSDACLATYPGFTGVRERLVAAGVTLLPDDYAAEGVEEYYPDRLAAIVGVYSGYGDNDCTMEFYPRVRVDRAARALRQADWQGHRVQIEVGEYSDSEPTILLSVHAPKPTAPQPEKGE